MQQLKDYIRPKFGFTPRSSLAVIKTDNDILCGAYGLSANSGAALNFLKLYFPSIVKHIDTLKTEAYAKFLWVKCYNSVPSSLFKEFEDNYFDEIYFNELKETLKLVVDIDRMCDGLKVCFYSWLMESTPEDIKNTMVNIFNYYHVVNIETIGSRQLVNAIYDHRNERYPNIRYKVTERNAVLDALDTATIYGIDVMDIYESNKYDVKPIYGTCEFKWYGIDTISMKIYPSKLSPTIAKVSSEAGHHVIGYCNGFYQTNTGFFVEEDDIVVTECDPLFKEVTGYVRLSHQHLEFENASTFSKVLNTIPRGTNVSIIGITEDGEYYKTKNDGWILSNNIEYTYTYKLLYRIRPKDGAVTLTEPEDGMPRTNVLSSDNYYDVSEVKNGYFKIEPELGWMKVTAVVEKE